MTCKPLRGPAIWLAAAATALAAPALAEDARIVSHRFNADEVVRVAGRSGVQATIVLAEDERIENVAIGDSTLWQVTPNKRANVLFVKPLAPRARTNMTVISDRRTYLFDLVAGAEGRPLYVLRFSYPDEPKPASALAGAQPTLTEAEAQAAAGKVREASVDPATLNFAWQKKGKSQLLPARVYDDGQSTFLTWSPQAPIPALQIRNDAGVEGPVNFAVRGDVIVIDGVPDTIVLRAGKDMATLRRTGAPARPAAPLPEAPPTTAPTTAFAAATAAQEP